MSMPGADFRPDDGPYSECVVCGGQVAGVPDYDEETGVFYDVFCEECAQAMLVEDD